LYFYFDFNDKEKSRVETLIRSIIAQICAQRSTIPSALDRLFARNQDGALQAPLNDLLDVLPQILNGFRSIYIVVDALDECLELEEALKVLHQMHSWGSHIMHIIVTSRDLAEIGTSLADIVTDTISVDGPAVNDDISLFISEMLQNDPKLARWPLDVREMISRALNGGARSM